ncbi:MAG: hypothetical protein EVA65_05290 [Oceanococcus sp.]|nr:MAG: hypothetical protein EVA65_05290 [Oceanococcus sp.]
MEHTTTLYLTWGIIGVIAVMTAYALVSRRPGVALNAPSILTSLGIFGTFLGITIGLAGFDPANVASSVTYLFGGIKLAFWTSVAGILGGILVKFRHLFLFRTAEGGEKVSLKDLIAAMRGVEASLTDDKKSPLLASLRDIQAESRDQARSQAETLKSSVDAVAAALDASEQRDQALLDQLKAMDSASGAGFDKLAAATSALEAGLGERLDGQAQRHSESTAEQMRAVGEAIQGLRGAMGEDTGQLIEQLDRLRSGSDALGERLNEAVAANGQSLADSVQKMSGALREAAERDASSLRDSLTENAKRSTEQMQAVARAIETLQGAMGEDSAQLLQRMDALRSGSETLGDKLADVLGANNQALAEALQNNRDAMAAQVTTAVSEIRDALVGPDGAAAGLKAALQSGQADLAGALAQVSQSLRGQVEKDLAKLNAGLAAGSEKTAAQMSDVAKAIQTLQSALGGDNAALLERMDTLRSGSEALGDKLADVLGANNQALAEAMQNNRDAMAAQITTAVSEIRDALVGPDGAAAELKSTMQGGQLELAKALARVSEGLRGGIEKDLAALNVGLTSSSEKTAAQMSGVAKAIESLQTALGGDNAALLERMENLRSGSEALGDKLADVLGANNQALAEAMQNNRDAMAAQVTTAVTDIRDALVGPDGAARTVTAELGKQLQQGQMELAKALARTSEALRGAMGDDAAALIERLDNVNSGLGELSDGMVGALGEMGGGLSGDVNNLATTVADAVDDLRMAIVGPDGARDGIVDEMRNAHDDTKKQLSAIHKALEENTQRQVDYSPKGLMDVLEELIKQFNTQFSGQFWEKIGGFNHAISELIEWMETYRTQLDDMVAMQSRSTKNMDTATRRFDEIASKSEIFIDVSRNISALLGGIDSQRVQIENHLKRFAHIVDETSKSLENIEERIVAGNSDMNRHLSDIAERIEEQVIRVDHAMDDELKRALTTFGQQLAALSEKFVEDYTPLTNRLREVVGIAREM